MMTSKLTPTLLLLSLCASSLVMVSCLGTEVGNPEDASVSVQFEGVSQVASALSLSNGVTIDEVWISVGDLELWTPSKAQGGDMCGGPKLTLAQSTTFVELISADELPGPLESSVDASQYCRAKLKLQTPQSKEALPEGAPEQLRDYTILVRGKRPDQTPFELRVRDQRVLWFEPSSAQKTFELGQGKTDLLINFELAQWFDVDALAALEPDQEGLLIIDSTGPQGALARDFMKRFRQSARLVKDANADGRLQVKEPLLALGSEDDDE